MPSLSRPALYLSHFHFIPRLAARVVVTGALFWIGNSVTAEAAPIAPPEAPRVATVEVVAHPVTAPVVAAPVAAHAATSSAAAVGEDDMARRLLAQALDNQYRGRYQAALEITEDSFINGKDSLSGTAEFADEVGERKVSLAGEDKSFEYQSLNYGKEQWIVDGRSHRVRRIANRQWKKGLFGSLFSFEDMLKFPSDFFLEYSSCKGVKTTDSTYQISMLLRPSFQSVYSKLEVTLSRQPVVLKAITFFGPQDQKLKTMEILGYKSVDGKQLPSDLQVFDCDSLSNLKMCFRRFSFSESPVARKSESTGGLVSKLGKAESLPAAVGDVDAPE